MSDDEGRDPLADAIASGDDLMAYLLSSDLVQWAEAGDLNPLIEHLESGGAISGDIRDFLVRILKGDIPKRRGIKRLKAQADRYAEIGMDVWMIKKFQRVSTYRAMQIYIDKHPSINYETLRSIVRKQKV